MGYTQEVIMAKRKLNYDEEACNRCGAVDSNIGGLSGGNGFKCANCGYQTQFRGKKARSKPYPVKGPFGGIFRDRPDRRRARKR